MSRNGEDRNEKPGNVFSWFFHWEAAGSIILLVCSVGALAWANSPWFESYFHLQHTKISVAWGEASLSLSLHHWINDGLMVIFFFVVGLEIKREVVVGQLFGRAQGGRCPWRSARSAACSCRQRCTSGA